jgi:hypothetical protein
MRAGAVGRDCRMSDVIQISMLDALRPAMEEWLHERGLGLQHINDQPEDDDHMRTYAVVIPKGSPLEAGLSDPLPTPEEILQALKGKTGTFTQEDVRRWVQENRENPSDDDAG